MFNDGTPMSKWSFEKDKIEIEENEGKEIFEKILIEIDVLIRNVKTNFEFLATTELSDQKNYLDVYSSLMFSFSRLKTQDAILLTTSIFNRVNFFVTEDRRLVTLCNKKIRENYEVEIIKAGTGIKKLNSKIN